jgi:hypothetical protein
VKVVVKCEILEFHVHIHYDTSLFCSSIIQFRFTNYSLSYTESFLVIESFGFEGRSRIIIIFSSALCMYRLYHLLMFGFD